MFSSYPCLSLSLIHNFTLTLNFALVVTYTLTCAVFEGERPLRPQNFR